MAKPRRLVEYKTSRNSCKKCNTNLRYKNGNCVQCLLNREQQNRENIPYYNKVKEKAKTRYYNDVELSRAKLRENRNRNKEEINLNRRIQYKENPEPKRLAIYKWRKTNPNKQKEIQLRYDNLNKEKRKALAKRLKPRYKESIKIASKRHYINNKYLYVEKSRRRAATKLQATPSWINIDKIREVYKEAQKQK